MINLLLHFLFLKLLKRHIGQGAVGTTAGLSIPVVQVAEHLFCHFPEHENLSVGQPTREQAVRFSQTGADLRVKLESALCWHQTFQPRVAGDAFPDNDAVFLQKLQNSRRSRTTQTERIFDIALKNRPFLEVNQDVMTRLCTPVMPRFRKAASRRAFTLCDSRLIHAPQSFSTSIPPLLKKLIDIVRMRTI